MKNKVEIDALGYLKPHKQLCALKEVAEEYQGHTIEDIIVHIEEKKKEFEKNMES